jgi:hypothetical protein
MSDSISEPEMAGREGQKAKGQCRCKTPPDLVGNLLGAGAGPEDKAGAGVIRGRSEVFFGRRTWAFDRSQNPHDVLFALLYLVDGEGQRAALADQSGLGRESPPPRLPSIWKHHGRCGRWSRQEKALDWETCRSSSDPCRAAYGPR